MTCGRYRLLHVPARLTHGGLGVDCDCRDVALGNRDRGGVREHRRDPHPADPTISTQPSRTLECEFPNYLARSVHAKWH
jgi:hypothetical protein